MNFLEAKVMVYNPQLRQRIAQTSACLIVQEGISDYQQAKYKAAARLGIPNLKELPSNSEIETEILNYQRLFQADTQPRHLQHLRKQALEAMRLFSAFTPRLVGSVLNGRAHQYSEITLHLFTDSAEEVAFLLMEKSIPYELKERQYRLSQTVIYPCYQFLAGEEKINLVVFKENDIRWAPPSQIDGKPMRRANLRTVEKLLINC
jgi:hypothetical protein